MLVMRVNFSFVLSMHPNKIDENLCYEISLAESIPKPPLNRPDQFDFADITTLQLQAMTKKTLGISVITNKVLWFF